MLSSQEEQEDRRRTLQNDARVREHQREQSERQRVFAQDQSLPKQATTFHQFAQADALTPRGRFSAVETSYVIGSKAGIASAYGACSSALAVQLPDEPPLDDNPALEVASTVPTPQATDGPADVPSTSVPPGSMSERAGPSPLSSGDMTADGEQSRKPSVMSPVTYRRF